MLRHPRHPGRTKAQRRALDDIGCGDNCPRMTKRTRESLLETGLIVKCGQRVFGNNHFRVLVPMFEMPVSVHMEWCAFRAHEAQRFLLPELSHEPGLFREE